MFSLGTCHNSEGFHGFCASTRVLLLPEQKVEGELCQYSLESWKGVSHSFLTEVVESKLSFSLGEKRPRVHVWRCQDR